MNVDGLDELLKIFKSSSKEFEKEGQKTVDKLGRKLTRLTKSKTPVDSGVLRRSWISRYGELQYTLSNSVEYAPHVEYGHRVVGGKGRAKGKRRKGNKKGLGKRTSSGKRYVEGVYMLTKSVKEIEKDLEKDFSIMIENLWK